MTSIYDYFKKCDIVFDDKIIDTSLINVDGSKFGILNLVANIMEHNSLTHELLFMVDRSASMEEQCGDGKTKMQHICHILKNMVGYFKEHPAINVIITISTFDDKCDTVLERTTINSTNFRQILEIIDGIMPRGSTNIERAINHTNQHSSKIRSQFPTHNVCNVFMTDGQATTGNQSEDVLYGLIDRTIDNTIIGVGLDHDGTLLSRLGSGKNSNYYFIDKLENSGFVYGEIIHGFIYKILNNLHITIDNGLIYDYKNNTWVTTLVIETIVSESNKTYHIATHNLDNCSVSISGINLDGRPLEHATVKYAKEDGFTDLDKFIYRQRTLQHLYDIREFIKKRDKQYVQDVFGFVNNIELDKTMEEEQLKIKTNLEDFKKELKTFMTSNNLVADCFMKNLCDDICICYRTFTTKHASMYASSRQASQGAQRCYTVTHIDTPQRLIRSVGNAYGQQMTGQFDTFIDDDSGTNGNGLHIITDFDDTQSPYSTQSSVKFMRAISGNSRPTNVFNEDNVASQNV